MLPVEHNDSINAKILAISEDKIEGFVREPFEVSQDEEIVAAVSAAAGGTRPIGGASYWADSAFIAATGIPTVLFGPGGEGAHAEVEWVSVGDTETVARTLIDVASAICA